MQAKRETRETREKREYYATLWVTDKFMRGSASWHTTITVAQLLNQDDIYKNIANAMNLNYQRQLRNEAALHAIHYHKDPEKVKVLLEDSRKVASTGETEWGETTYRGCLLVKLLLDPGQVGTEARGQFGMEELLYLNGPIRASDIYGIYAHSLVSNHKFKLFLVQPDASTLAANEIAVLKKEDIFYYMLKDDEVPMPVTDFEAANVDYPLPIRFYQDTVYDAVNYMYNHRSDGATLEGRTPSAEWFRRRGLTGLMHLLGFVAAIGKIDSRVPVHGQMEADFPFNETREDPGYEFQKAAAPYGFFNEPKSKEKQVIREAKKDLVENLFLCSLTGEVLKAPVFNTKDKKTYSKAAIEGTQDFIVNDRLAAEFIGKPAINDVEMEELLLCPITQEVMQDPYFCTLDGYTYEKDAIKNWLKRNPSSPITPAEIPAGQGIEDVLFPHSFAQAIIVVFQQKSEHAVGFRI